MDLIHKYISYVQIVVMLVSGLFGLRLIGRKTLPRYLSNFYWYPLMVVIASTLNLSYIICGIPDLRVLDEITNLSILFHFTFLGHFIVKNLPSQRISKIASIIFYAFLLLTVFCYYSNLKFRYQSIAFSVANFGLVMLCCCYYAQVFHELQARKLNLEPIFWIINGIFVGMCPAVPTVALKMFLIQNARTEVVMAIDSIACLGYIIMYLFFIKAYLCAIRFHIPDEARLAQTQ